MGKRRRAAVVVAATVAVGLVAGPYATEATAEKKARPAHVVASADFVALDNCAPGPGFEQYGHIELNAFDDDLVPVVNSWDRQDDRISMELTWDSGQAWTPDALAVEINADGDTAFIPVTGWGISGFTLHDGGNPGTALSGGSFLGVPATVDWAHFNGIGMCGDPTFYLTDGNIRINPASP